MKIKLLFNWHFWYEVRYKVKCFFNPKQEWLTNIIPDTHCDKVELIPRLLFKCLEHYVEVELKQYHSYGLGEYNWSDEVDAGFITQAKADDYVKRDEELLEAYRWIKNGRRDIDKQINEAYPETEFDEVFFEREDGNYDMVFSDERKEAYKEVSRLEALKLEKDMEAMQIIVKYHQRLWT